LESGEDWVGGGDAGEFGDLGGVVVGYADPQPVGLHGQPDGDGADDAEGQPQGHPAEPASTGVVELPELGNGRRRCLDPGGQGHRDRERQRHGNQTAVSGGMCDQSGRLRCGAESVSQHGCGQDDEPQRHDREHSSPEVTEPGQRRDRGDQA
jgi:hypothetical protein